MKIPITEPFFDDSEKHSVAELLEKGWIVQGPKVQLFEELVAKFTAAKFARATTSCTTALHLALLSCGIKQGDEVIVPSFTFVATANVVEYLKAKPVLVDIDLKTYNIDPQKIEEYVNKNGKKGKVKAIIPVHLFGLSADIYSILKISKTFNLKVIEDAACGLGAIYHGKHCGTFGDAGCLSFHPRKSITTGEGGMILTNNPEIAKKVSILRNHGASIPDWQRHLKKGYLLPEYNLVGYNYRMTDIQGAIGCEQMKKLKKILNRKRYLAKRYNKLLSDFGWLRLPYVPADCLHGWQSYVCLFSYEEPKSIKIVEKMSIKRNKLMDFLESSGISTRQGTHAVHLLGYYRKKYGFKTEEYFNSFIADQLSIALPLYYQMTETQQDYVVEMLKKAYKKCVA